MKRIALLSALIVFALGIGLPGSHAPGGACASLSTTPAHAQAINYEAILTTLRSMQEDIGRMINLVEKHRDGIVQVGDEEVALSAGQKTQIINKYTTIKAAMAAKYQTLP